MAKPETSSLVFDREGEQALSSPISMTDRQSRTQISPDYAGTYMSTRDDTSHSAT